LRVLGAPVDAVDMAGAVHFVGRGIRCGERGRYVLAVNPEKVMALQHAPGLKLLFENAALLIPDGIGVVLALWMLYRCRVRRVPGAELTPNICRLAVAEGYRVFVYGAKEEVNRRAVHILTMRFPGIRIVGRENGYLPEAAMPRLVQRINDSGAEILFVALGSPKQEEWIRTWLPGLNVAICQGIGGTLDVLAGNVIRAPKIFRALGMEWFYRLLSNPRRLKRQLVLPKFALAVLREKARRRRDGC
jgi:N-acetylglucosaminyldiphosphoundecaprenol N-acetyl-beta-D-mannosaminyltransferase